MMGRYMNWTVPPPASPTKFQGFIFKLICSMATHEKPRVVFRDERRINVSKEPSGSMVDAPISPIPWASKGERETVDGAT